MDVGGRIIDDGYYFGFRTPLTSARKTVWLVFGAEIVQSYAAEYHLGVGGGSAVEVVF